MAGFTCSLIMGKQTRHDWPQVLESLLSEGTKLAARWLPKGAEGLEQQIRLRAGELQKFQQSRKRQQLSGRANPACSGCCPCR